MKMCHFHSSTAAVAASLCILILIAAASQANDGKQKDKSAVYEADSSKGIVLSRNEANTYHKDGHRSRRFIFGNLAHECYSEGCTLHEVQEALGYGRAAEEYYKDYRCSRGALHYCKVTCHYRLYCSYTAWSQWSGRASASGCSTQSRFKTHSYPKKTTTKRGRCRGLDDKCSTPPRQERLLCTCAKVECQYGQWSNWIGDIHDGKCTVQTRTKPYTLLLKAVSKVGSCQDSVQNSCLQRELRTRCSCLKANCLLNEWTSWHTVTSVRECDVQTRTRYYKTLYVYEQRAQNCANVRKDCPPAISSNRTICNCTYRSSCELTEWSFWRPNISGAECKKQNRTRNFIQQSNYAQRLDNCVGLNTCKEKLEETRNLCGCKYRESCELKEWSTWNNPVTEIGCKTQTRTRVYRFPLKHIQDNNCTGLVTTCLDEPVKEERTLCKCKYVRCQQFWTGWEKVETNDSFTETKRSNLKGETYNFHVGKCSNDDQGVCMTREEVIRIHSCQSKECRSTDFKIPFIISLFFAVLFLLVIVIAIWCKYRSCRKSFQSIERRSTRGILWNGKN